MNIRMRKGLSLYLILCCVLVLAFGIGLQTGGRMQQSRAELVSGSAEHAASSSKPKPHFSGKQLSLRDVQQWLAVHRTAEIQENAYRRTGLKLLYHVLPPVLVLTYSWTLQEAVQGLHSPTAGDDRMRLENIRCERLII